MPSPLLVFLFDLDICFDGSFDIITLTPSTTPVIGDAILYTGKYYVVMHKVINETNTYLVSPFFANAPS